MIGIECAVNISIHRFLNRIKNCSPCSKRKTNLDRVKIAEGYLTEISEQARTKLSQLSTLHLRIVEVQPHISNVPAHRTQKPLLLTNSLS